MKTLLQILQEMTSKDLGCYAPLKKDGTVVTNMNYWANEERENDLKIYVQKYPEAYSGYALIDPIAKTIIKKFNI
jgi:hypothetical protein